jgi:L-ascorbate metabolism protein UlaG (beta-lactamase superfamily)
VDATLDWYGCATFRLVLDDLVLFLDAYLDRVPDAAQSGVAVDDVDRADWVLVGHSHFDHLWGAERIAPRTGATIVGSYETVRIMADHGVAESQLIPVAGGERIRLSDDVTVSVFPSLHSCVWTHRQMHQSDQVCLGDLGVTWQEQRSRFAALAQHLADLSGDVRDHLIRARQGGRGDGGALVYLIETPQGSLLYQDTSGHWTGVLQGLQPDVAILAAAGRGNLDGEPIQGSLADFVGRQAELLRPQRLLLSHHDDWLPGFSIATDTGPIGRAGANRAPATEFVEIGYTSGYPLFGVTEVTGIRPPGG